MKTGNEPLAKAIYTREQAALMPFPMYWKPCRVTRLFLKPFNLVGLDALRQLLVDTPVQGANYR